MAAGTMELKAFSVYVAVLAVFFAFPVPGDQYFLILDCRTNRLLTGDDGVLRRGCRCIYLVLLGDLLRSEWLWRGRILRHRRWLEQRELMC